VVSASGLGDARHAVLIIAALILGLMTAILGVALGVFPRRPQTVAGKPLRALLGLDRHAA
jgi:hypothetical protein